MNKLGTVLVCGTFAFAGGLASHWLIGSPQKAIADSKPLSALGYSEVFEQVSRRVSPAVVSIEAVKPPAPAAAGSTTPAKTKPVEESGSGVMVHQDGIRGTLVITNNHVIAGAKPDQITVNLSDNRLLKPVQVWSDPESDIAVLRLDVEGLPTLPFADSDKVAVGQWVLAFGSPFGLNQTVTHGIISAKERGQVSLGSTIRIKEFLQTDAAINPGSSGGPLLNLNSEIVGINTAIASHSGSNSGVAFSIPANLVKRVLRQLVEKGTVARGYLGVQLAGSIEPNDANRLGLDKAAGALIDSVYPETPAALAGLRTNDVILRVDDITIRNDNHLINMISNLPAGQRVKLQLWRDRKVQAIDAVVGDWAKAQSRMRASNVN
jgi:serine protease Do